MNKNLNNIIYSTEYISINNIPITISISSNLVLIAKQQDKIVRKIEVKDDTLIIDSASDDILYFLLDELFLELLRRNYSNLRIITKDVKIINHYLLNQEGIKDLNQNLIINDKKYYLISLLGHGKGGYSYLVSDKKNFFVLKQIHHEPCSYYSFGNKIESELRDYNTLLKTGINIPKMIDVDLKNERILKDYIPGFTISKYIEEGQLKKEYLKQVITMSKVLKDLNINIDYYPTNFIVYKDILYYIDYECNPYMSEWDFDNWGIKYWQN